MFHTLLIANRGEIACRIAATARRMGISTVAVYSDADAGAAHVAACDHAVRIGPAAPRDSYLNIDAVLAAARASGADAVHPGYGFLSENPRFAEACANAGLVFVGPPAAAMEAMGDKSAAKARMQSAGVPLVPGYHGSDQSPEHLQRQADTIGYPIILKPSAGGGGKGMRIVHDSASFNAQLQACQREARSSFGDDRVLIERYLQRPRHIEIQIFADTHGHCVHLFERDCSLQRRHQKVIEEAPAPGLDQSQRDAMGAAAIAAAHAVDYVGAGTVEFIVDADGTFYFMEMNTRLQVEHPVTELITGQDLVAWQLQVAAGAPLPLTQAQLHCRGHAIETRIYAECPETGFLPATGTLQHLAWPEPHTQFHASQAPSAIRIDSGVRSGDVIGPDYDPMIAKLIVWGADRAQALGRLRQALADTRITGVLNNTAFLGRLAAHPAVIEGELDTGLIERHQHTLLPRPTLPAATLAAAVVADHLENLHCSAHHDPDPWSVPDAWRVGLPPQQALTLRLDGYDSHLQLFFTQSSDHYSLGLEPNAFQPLTWQCQPLPALPPVMATDYRLQHGLAQTRATVVRNGAQRAVFIDGEVWFCQAIDPLQPVDAQAASQAGSLNAPMPGKIVAVLVEPGATVEAGQALMTLEAMKMEHTLTAPHAGRVEEIFYAVGDLVQEGNAILALAANADPERG